MIDMYPIADAKVNVGKTPGEQDTVYQILSPTLAMTVEFIQDPVDPSTFRRYIGGVRR